MSNKVCPRNCVADCSECELEEKDKEFLEILKDYLSTKEIILNFNNPNMCYLTIKGKYDEIVFAIPNEKAYKIKEWLEQNQLKK